MKVYRVQGPSGEGIMSHRRWRSYSGPHLLRDGTERFMHPDCDRELYDYVMDMSKHPNIWKFGFRTLIDLLLWFKLSELERLNKDGWYVYEIEAETVVSGSRQVIFKDGYLVRTVNGKELVECFMDNEKHIRYMYNDSYSSSSDDDSSSSSNTTNEDDEDNSEIIADDSGYGSL